MVEQFARMVFFLSSFSPRHAYPAADEASPAAVGKLFSEQMWTFQERKSGDEEEEAVALRLKNNFSSQNQFLGLQKAPFLTLMQHFIPAASRRTSA